MQEVKFKTNGAT